MKRFTLTCLALAAVNLSGCAQIMNIGDMMWSETKQITVGSKNKVLAMLRPRSQRQDPIFTEASHYIQGQTPIDLEMFELVEDLPPAPIRRYVSSSNIQFYGPTQHSAHNLAGGLEPSYFAPPVEPEMPDLSYVKLAGKTSAIDWQNCQNQAGGYITADDSGFKVRPDFDYCMRVNGYIPEREALQFMDSQILP